MNYLQSGGELSETPALTFLQHLILDYTPGNPVLGGDLEAVVGDMLEAVSSGAITASDAATILDLMRHDLGDDASSYYSEIAELLVLNADAPVASAIGEAISGHEGVHFNTVDDDYFVGSSDADSYFYHSGLGSDTIQEAGSGNDSFVFLDLNAADVTFAQSGGGDLVMTAGAETITVVDHFHSSNEDMETITFADGTSLDLAGIACKVNDDVFLI